MSNLPKKTAWALAIGLVMVCVFPVAADVIVCLDERPDRGCCDETPVPDLQAEAEVRLLGAEDCQCCVRVHVVSNAANGTAHKFDVVHGVKLRNAPVPEGPIAGRLMPVGRDEHDDARLPSLRTVVLLI